MPRMADVRRILRVLLISSAVIFFLATSTSIDAQQTPAPPTVQDGIFSDAQAVRGQALYAQRCAGCHGPALEGTQAPPLAGEAFRAKFRMEPLSALFIKIRYTMPPRPQQASAEPGQGTTTQPPPAPPQLTPAQGADLVAHVLKSNGFPAGKSDFPAADATKSAIGWPAGGAGAAAAATHFPTGTVNQLMRGVFFPNSNLIFTVQEMEPQDMPPRPPASRPDGLTIFDWGQLVYTGWPVVENAASALADASALMLQPGLRCENGRLAPITEPDWIRFTERMVSIAKRTYRLAQTKDKEAVSEFTADLSNACNACHSTYRDVGGRGRGRGAAGGAAANSGPAPGSARCMHR